MKYTVEYYPFDFQQGDEPDIFGFETIGEMFNFVNIQLRSVNESCGLDFSWLEENTYQLSEYRSETMEDYIKSANVVDEINAYTYTVWKVRDNKNKTEKSIIDNNYSLN